jgi:hypothetical protein
VRALLDGIAGAVDPAVVAQAFVLFERTDAAEADVRAVAELALQGVAGELTCQAGRHDYDIDLGSAIYGLLRGIAEATPAAFPLERFVAAAQKVAARGAPFEVAEVVGTLAACFAGGHADMPSLYKKFVVRMFVDKLAICDFHTPPDPIAAVRVVIDREPEMLASEVPAILGFLEALLAGEYEGQLLFRCTLEYAVSLLFVMFRVVLRERMDVARFMPRMLAALPVGSDSPEEGLIIYASLVEVCGDFPELMGQFGVEVVRVLAQAMAVKEKEWRQLALPEEVTRACVVLLGNLVGSMRQGREIVIASVGDEAAMQRLTRRMEEFAEH